MDFEVGYTYWEDYLPSPRCRNFRKRETNGSMTITIPDVSKEDAPIAFIVRDGVRFDRPEEIRLWNNQLWKAVEYREMYCGASGLWPIEQIPSHIKYTRYGNVIKNEQETQEQKKEIASSFLIIDGVVYRKSGEPRYVVMTFGLGYNHGGTSLMIDKHYNSNISASAYFNALDREDAIKAAKAIALRRGDTKDVDRMGNHYQIEVLIPSAVKCNPKTEHGDGDPFLNDVEALISAAGDSTVAGLALIGKVSELFKHNTKS
jgi:hypothetical protein